ncbi:MAG TPA: VWA domain-containing protein, partial [Chloroflexota bacterium]|nr:VWA domain-containing protein [Chloroflexota bacterium]
MIGRDHKLGGLAARLTYLLAFLLLLQNLAPVAEAASLGVTIERVDSASFPTVTIFGSVANDQGLPITGLDQSAFGIFEDNKAVEQFTVRSNANAEPVAATFLIDTSSTTGSDGELAAAKLAANAFIDKMNTNDTAAIISFGGQAQLVQGFTNDKAKLKAAIDGLKSNGSRAQYDAISLAAAQQASAQAARRAIILTTDGGDNASTNVKQMGDAIKAANDSKTPVFTIGVG